MFHRFMPSFRRSASAKPNRRPTTQLLLETLEDRCVPTVTSSLVNHVLTITGDNGDNHITIQEQATPGSYAVSATDGLVGISNPTDVWSIVVDTKGGSDTVCFVGDATSGTVLKKSLTVSGEGKLSVDVKSNFNVAGDVSITDTGSQGLKVMTAGPNTSFGNTTITGGSGGTKIDMKSSTINGWAVFNLGDGTNCVTLGNTNGDPADGVTVKKSLTIYGGAGDDKVLLENNTYIGGDLSAKLYGGCDTFETNGKVDSGSAPEKPFAQVGITVAGNLCVTATGKLDCAFDATTVQRNLNIDTSHSALKSDIELDAALILGNLSIDSGSGADCIAIQATVNGTTHICTDGGNDKIIIADSIFKKEVDIDMGSGSDTLLVEPKTNPVANADGIQTQFFKKLTVNMGGGDDHVILGETGGDPILFFAKNNKFDGGTGTNTIATTNAKFYAGDPTIVNFV